MKMDAEFERVFSAAFGAVVALIPGEVGVTVNVTIQVDLPGSIDPRIDLVLKGSLKDGKFIPERPKISGSVSGE